MALCTLVNRDDAVVEQKERGTLAPGDIYRVSALWVINSYGQVLLAQRLLTKKQDPGRWGPAVAGTIEDGETYEENIRKEAREELGIDGVAFKMGPKIFVEDNGFGQGYFAQTFVAVLDWPTEKFTPQASEVAGVQWFDAATLPEAVRNEPEAFVAGFTNTCLTLCDFVRENHELVV